MNRYSYITCIVILVFMACNKSTSYEQQFQQLARQEKVTKCVMQSIKSEVSDIWDQVNMQLRSQLEDIVPEQELKNMLNVRNADLISMFQTYDDLDPSTKALIHRADSLDQSKVKELLKVKSTLDSINKKKRKLLEQVENKAELETLKKVYQDIINSDCQKVANEK